MFGVKKLPDGQQGSWGTNIELAWLLAVIIWNLNWHLSAAKVIYLKSSQSLECHLHLYMPLLCSFHSPTLIGSGCGLLPYGIKPSTRTNVDFYANKTLTNISKSNFIQVAQYFFFFIKTYLTRMTHQPEAVLHEVLPYTITQFIHMVTKINIKHRPWYLRHIGIG